MSEEDHQRWKKMASTMVVGEEDDVDPAVYYTKCEINWDLVPGRKWCNMTRVERQELMRDGSFALRSMAECTSELRMTRVFWVI